MGKNHSTNKERSFVAKKKQRRGKFKVATRKAKWSKLKVEIALYWRGERETFPCTK